MGPFGVSMSPKFASQSSDKPSSSTSYKCQYNNLSSYTIIERVHKQLFSRRLRLRVARVVIEKPRSDEFMKT